MFTRRPSLERRDVARGITVRERTKTSVSILDVGDSSRAFVARDERRHDDLNDDLNDDDATRDARARRRRDARGSSTARRCPSSSFKSSRRRQHTQNTHTRGRQRSPPIDESRPLVGVCGHFYPPAPARRRRRQCATRANRRSRREDARRTRRGDGPRRRDARAGRGDATVPIGGAGHLSVIRRIHLIVVRRSVGRARSDAREEVR